MRLIQLFLSISSVYLLSACSTSTGDHYEDDLAAMSLQEIEEQYDQLRLSEYDAVTSKADLNTETFPPLTSLFLHTIREEYSISGEEPLSSQTTSLTQLKLIPEPWTDNTTAPDDNLELHSRIPVNEAMRCENAEGKITLTGSLNEYATGALAIKWSNCLSEGITINGRGVIYFRSPGKSDATFFFHRLNITEDQSSVWITGSITYYEDSPYDRSWASITVEDQLRQQTYMVTNWRNTNDPLSDYPNGQLYHSRLGYIDISSKTALQKNNPDDNYYYSGHVLFEGNNQQIGHLEFTTPPLLWIDINQDEREDLITFADLEAIEINDFDSIEFVEYADF